MKIMFRAYLHQGDLEGYLDGTAESTISYWTYKSTEEEWLEFADRWPAYIPVSVEWEV